mmetsp:Transcript_20297/g.24268  ORF Transcript_20297/g.24268 Transcript_20297/m.24268 type:complete len:87 (+) Transcript_20297:220-480(+)
MTAVSTFQAPKDDRLVECIPHRGQKHVVVSGEKMVDQKWFEKKSPWTCSLGRKYAVGVCMFNVFHSVVNTVIPSGCLVEKETAHAP